MATSPKVDPSANAREQFHLAWDEFTASVRRARSRVANRPDTALTPSLFHLLSALEGGKALTVGELAAAAGGSSPPAPPLLDALEREDIVRRQPSVVDRRRISVEMTDAGKKAVAATRRRLAKARDLVYEELSPDERAQAARLLSRLADAIEQI
jgi:DNA-binding MarR family transcriptional regulator